MKLIRITGILLFLLSSVSFVGFRIYEHNAVDVIPPVITIPEDTAAVSVFDTEQDLLKGVTAMDDKDGDVTASLLIEEISKFHSGGNRTITYAAFDSSGNIVRAQREITYSDYHSPRFALVKPLYFNVGDEEHILDHLMVQDLIDGDLTDKIKYEAFRDDFGMTEGIFDVEFQVTNSAGDTSYLTTEVEFRYPSYKNFNDAPQIVLRDYVRYIPVGELVDAFSFVKGIAKGNKEYTVTEGEVKMISYVNNQKPGTYAIEYFYTDEDGSTATTKLLVIVEE